MPTVTTEWSTPMPDPMATILNILGWTEPVTYDNVTPISKDER